MAFDTLNILVAIIGIITGSLVTIATKYIGSYEERKLRRMDLRATAIIEDMLNHKLFVERTFRAIRARVPGYTNNELRRLLLEIGAIRVMKSRLAGKYEERYVLKSRWVERNTKIAAGEWQRRG